MERALLVGINAYPAPDTLHGCVNDVDDMAAFLQAQCGFTAAEITIVQDEHATAAAIRAGIGKLTHGLKAGDHAVFHYSGHGAQMPSKGPGETKKHVHDTICPFDFDWSDAKAIRDVDFQALFQPIPKDVHFVWMSDSCYSGGLAKVMGRDPHPDARPKRMLPSNAAVRDELEKAREAGAGPVATSMRSIASFLNLSLISGCTSQQESEDAYFGQRPNGALTYYLLKELATPKGLTQPMKDCVTHVDKALAAAKYDQKPELHGLPALGARGFA